MKELPDDLATMETDDLVQQRGRPGRASRATVSSVAALSHIELRQLKNLYAERVRIARYLGRLGGRLRCAEPPG